jgi:adenosine kinase
VTSDEPNSPKSFSVKPLSDSQIVDTNGAGDAFAGLVAGKNLDESILAGHALASACVQEVSSRTVDK